jgi:hypothetical protein
LTGGKEMKNGQRKKRESHHYIFDSSVSSEHAALIAMFVYTRIHMPDPTSAIIPNHIIT